MIVEAYKRKLELNPRLTIRKARETISKELGIGQNTISKTLAQYRGNKNVSEKTKNFKEIDTKLDAIRRKIYQFWFNRELPTLDKVLTVVNEDKSLPNFSRTTLYRSIKYMDFEYVKRGRSCVLMEKNETLIWRKRYLRNIQKYREEGRPIYYLDEMWVNSEVTSIQCSDITVRSSRDAFSQGLLTGAVNPTGIGKRLIVGHIGSNDGFVPGALLCFESKNNTHHYYDEIDGDCFRDWLEGVLPKLKDNAVIVMDNAPYHSVKKEECPTIQWKRADIIEWLRSKGEVIDNSMMTHELLEIVKRIKPMYSQDVIDEMVLKHNKKVLRLPPYHNELNPIELAWCFIKIHVNSHNKTFKLADVRNLLTESVEKVTTDMWVDFIGHTIKEENKFWDMENVAKEVMAEIETVDLTVGISDTDDSD